MYQDGILRLHADLGNGEWEECFVVRRVSLPPGYFFGVTAATGELADNHDIISFKVRTAQGGYAGKKTLLSLRPDVP